MSNFFECERFRLRVEKPWKIVTPDPDSLGHLKFGKRGIATLRILALQDDSLDDWWRSRWLLLFKRRWAGLLSGDLTLKAEASWDEFGYTHSCQVVRQGKHDFRFIEVYTQNRTDYTAWWQLMDLVFELETLIERKTSDVRAAQDILDSLELFGDAPAPSET